MAGKVRLVGPESGVEAKVHTPSDYGHEGIPGLVVYSHNLETGTPILKFFTDEDGAVDQNINASGAGTLTGIHDGTDSVLWTAAAVSGTWDFASTTQANTGTKSIQLGTKNGDIASFTNGADLTVTDYSDVRGYIYITSWPSSGNKNITVQLYLNGAPVSDTLNLSVYVDTTVQDSWQLFDIPIGDFNSASATFDAVWVTMVDGGAGSAPSGFLDDISLVQTGTGGQASFTLAPPVDEVWVINRLKWTAVATSSSIKPNEFFGISALTNGYQLIFKSGGISSETFQAYDFFDMAQYPNVTLNIISGTNSIFEVYFDIPQEQQVLVGRLGQSLELVVRDDLSAMSEFRAAAQGYKRRVV